MAEIDFISTTKAPPPGGHYSSAAMVGDVVFTAGQVGLDPATGQRAPDFAGEVRQSLANLEAVLSERGLDRTNIVRTMCLLTDTADFPEFNALYAEFFGEHKPARSTFAVGLAGGFTFEIEAIAAARRDLAAVGNNLNQLARLGAVGRLHWKAGDAALVRKVAARVDDLVDEVVGLIAEAQGRASFDPVVIQAKGAAK